MRRGTSNAPTTSPETSLTSTSSAMSTVTSSSSETSTVTSSAEITLKMNGNHVERVDGIALPTPAARRTPNSSGTSTPTASPRRRSSAHFDGNGLTDEYTSRESSTSTSPHSSSETRPKRQVRRLADSGTSTATPTFTTSEEDDNDDASTTSTNSNTTDNDSDIQRKIAGKVRLISQSLENVQQRAAGTPNGGLERNTMYRARPVGRSQSVNWKCRPVPKGRLVELIASLNRQSSFSVKIFLKF